MAQNVTIPATMSGKSPYAPELITHCVTLWQKGISVEVISKNTGVPVRTLQRWNKNHGGGKPTDPDRISSDPKFQIALKAKPSSHSAATAWVDNLEATLDRLGGLHSGLIDDLRDLLDKAIKCSDPSPRAINTLSLCLDRHANSLLRVSLMGREKQIDIGQALSTLEAYGYSVFDSARLKDLFGGSEEDVEAVEGNETNENE